MQTNKLPPPLPLPLPWYRQFWPWFLITFPMTAVIAGIATVLIAVADPDGLVVADYYRQGLAINQDLAKQKHARSLGLGGELAINSQTGVVSLTLHGSEPTQPTVLMRMVHPTRSHRDRESMLYRDANGRLSGSFKLPSSGIWKIIVEAGDNSWRLTGRLDIARQTHADLEPG